MQNANIGLVDITLTCHFEVKDAEVFGGAGSVGYTSVALKHAKAADQLVGIINNSVQCEGFLYVQRKNTADLLGVSQKQRGKESRIRRTKTKLVGLRTAIETAEDAGVKATLEAQYTRTAKLLEKQNLDYNQFCEDNGLKRLSDRIQITRWTREDARKSIAAARSK